MPKLLIVSPNFPPKNQPDLHRVRTSLPFYRQYGWEPMVLCISPETSEGIDDPLLAQNLPQEILVISVDAWSEKISRPFGFGLLAYRALVPLYTAGTALLKREACDVVFFSTTQFPAFVLGPIWKRRFGCKIVYDFQDPWYRGAVFPLERKNIPGSYWKYFLDQQLARMFERFSLKSADHILSVSESYIAGLASRYSWLTIEKFTLMPFGAAPADYDFMHRKNVRQSVLPQGGDQINWVSAGAIAPAMGAVLRTFFQQLAALKARDPAFAAQLRIYFVGTNYAAAEGGETLPMKLAGDYGLRDMVVERPQRIPFFQSLSLYEDADAILMFGSDRGDYTASKLFSCLLSKKPVLAMFHEDSLVARIGKVFSSLRLVCFRDSKDAQFAQNLAAAMDGLKAPQGDAAHLDAEIAPWTAEKLTEAQCAIFDAICERP